MSAIKKTPPAAYSAPDSVHYHIHPPGSCQQAPVDPKKAEEDAKKAKEEADAKAKAEGRQRRKGVRGEREAGTEGRIPESG